MRATVRFCWRARINVADLLPVLRLHDKVLIRNCPPISARKRFKLERIINSPETVRELAHTELVTQS